MYVCTIVHTYLNTTGKINLEIDYNGKVHNKSAPTSALFNLVML